MANQQHSNNNVIIMFVASTDS